MRRRPHWGECRDEIARGICEKSRLLVAFDFDGTLAPIAPTPGDVSLPEETRRLLSKLASCRGVTVAIVSGRALDDVRRRVGLDEVIYCGNHGLEIEGSGIRWLSAEARTHRPKLADAVARLARVLASVEGAMIEDKGLTASVHWRLVPEERRAALREAVAEVVQADSGLRLSHGKSVYELRPRVDWNKGSAVRYLLTHAKLTARDAIYLGDDETDESVFRDLPDAMTMHVGSSPSTSARFRLSDVTDTARFLEHVIHLRVRAEQSRANHILESSHYDQAHIHVPVEPAA